MDWLNDQLTDWLVGCRSKTVEDIYYDRQIADWSTVHHALCFICCRFQSTNRRNVHEDHADQRTIDWLDDWLLILNCTNYSINKVQKVDTTINQQGQFVHQSKRWTNGRVSNDKGSYWSIDQLIHRSIKKMPMSNLPLCSVPHFAIWVDWLINWSDRT